MKKSVIVLAGLLCHLGVNQAAERPNILLILTDDQGWSQTSEPMDPRIPESRSAYLETPHMARLMREGMRFTSGYSPAPLCTPTRRSILCGTSAARSGSEFKSPWVPAEHLTIPKALKSVDPGYRCAHFGKWGELMISTPEECGYDASDGMTGNNTGGMPNTLKVKGSHEDGPPHFIDNEDPKRTNSVTARAIEFMREQVQAQKPFYVQASYYAQHLSVVCEEDTLVKYREKGVPDRGYTQAWAAMMEELDDGVGRLLDALDELGVAGNTYVLFTADNGGRETIPGGEFSESRLPTNHPLTGAKHDLYEGGIRVPFFVRGPGIEPGSACHVPVAGYDFLPTFLALAGGGPDGLTNEIDGTSLAPLFRDPAGAGFERSRGGLFFHRPGKKFSVVRKGDDKLMVFWTGEGRIESRTLYAVEPDPREIEERNLASAQAEKADALQKLLLDFLDSVDAERAKPNAAKKRTR